jgi:hypothetical protein
MDVSASVFHMASQKLGYPTERVDCARQKDLCVLHVQYNAASG